MPALLRLTVPRLEGHSFQDTQTYKSEALVKAEWARDPLPRLKDYLVPSVMSAQEWEAYRLRRAGVAERARAEAEARRVAAAPKRSPATCSSTATCRRWAAAVATATMPPTASDEAAPDGQRINMVTAIRRTLDHELTINQRVVLFGEDIGPKGGVHAVTLGLQDKFGSERVFDTSLSEEGIVGRAVGMALAGLDAGSGNPVPQICRAGDRTDQRLRHDALAHQQPLRQRPMVLRMPGGFFKCGDPGTARPTRSPSSTSRAGRSPCRRNAEDAVGLLRTALRGNDPVIFFEHRAMLDHAWARRPYPGDDYVLPFGKARFTRKGNAITIVTWGAMVPRCEEAAEGISADVIDLRTLMPWDRESVVSSRASHPALPDRPRGSWHRWLRRGDCRGGCRRGLHGSRRTGGRA